MKTTITIDLEQYSSLEESKGLVERIQGLILKVSESEDAFARMKLGDGCPQLVITTHVGRVAEIMSDLEEEGMLE